MPTIGSLPHAPADDVEQGAAVEALGEAVFQLVHAWRVAARRAPDTNQSVFAVLELVRLLGEGEHRMNEIADMRGVDQSVISRQITELQRKQLVCRRPDPSDGRASLVRLTDKGLAVLEKSRELRLQWLRGALARCPVEDVATAAKLVTALAEELEAHLPQLGQVATPPN